MKHAGVRVAALLLAVIGGALLAGCGGSDPDPPEQVVSDFFAATADKDGAKLCSLVTEETAQAAADQSDADSCDEGANASFEGSDSDAVVAEAEGVEVGEATIDGDSATVKVTSMDQEEEINLVKEGEEWKVDFG